MNSVTAAMLLALTLAPGCDHATDAPGSTPSTNAEAGAKRPTAAPGKGVIRGFVRLNGPAPEMGTIDTGRCHGAAGHADPVKEEFVVTGRDDGLKNAVVFLKEGPDLGAAPPPAELDQVNCRYTPHVLALHTGQTLRVKTSDAVMHNVHGLTGANPGFNFAMNGGAGPRDLVFSRPDEFAVRCDVHPWMLAYVHVFDHPYFAVTGDDGGFEILNVPVGEYTLVTRHEALGVREEPVLVTGNAPPITPTVVYKKPK